MSGLNVIEDPPRESWERVLENAGFGNLAETFEYGEMIGRVYPHTEVIRLLAIENGRPLGGIQGHYKKRYIYGGAVRVGDTYGSAPFTTLNGDEETEVARVLLENLEKHAHRRKILEAYVHWPRAWGLLNVFNDLGYEELENHYNVYCVDLKRSVSELWNSIDANKRRNVRKASTMGVEVVEANEPEDFCSFYEMLKGSAKRANFDPHLAENEGLWDLFKQKGSAKVFLAKRKGRAIAGVLALLHEDTFYARAAGSNSEAWEARPNDILHWRAMEWACERGFSKYHMGSTYDPLPTEGSDLWGLWRWKREWKGKLDRMCVFHKVYLPRLATFLHRAR